MSLLSVVLSFPLRLPPSLRDICRKKREAKSKTNKDKVANKKAGGRTYRPQVCLALKRSVKDHGDLGLDSHEEHVICGRPPKARGEETWRPLLGRLRPSRGRTGHTKGHKGGHTRGE